MTVIGVSGSIGAGKDTVAAYLVRAHGFVRVGFADALKAEVRQRFRRTLLRIAPFVMPLDLAFVDDDVRTLAAADDEAVLDWLLAHKPPIVRELLQEYGTEVRRADCPTYWLDGWKARAAGLERVVVPDVRFKNEASTLTGAPLFGRLVRVDRPGHHGAGHASETSLATWSRWDAIFPNTGTVADLEAAVAWWLEHP